jgi:hypothetical protein
MSKSNRRKFLSGAVAAGAVAGSAVPAAAQQKAERKVHWQSDKAPENPLFSPVVTYGNLVFVAGKGAHFEGDIKAHTEHVLKTIEDELSRWLASSESWRPRGSGGVCQHRHPAPQPR